jgi:hypothetical protein
MLNVCRLILFGAEARDKSEIQKKTGIVPTGGASRPRETGTRRGMFILAVWYNKQYCSYWQPKVQ